MSRLYAKPNRFSASLLWIACLFSPDLKRWIKESEATLDTAWSAASKLRASYYRNEVSPRSEFDRLIACFYNEEAFRAPSKGKGGADAHND
jgi:hypothetical protein